MEKQNQNQGQRSRQQNQNERSANREQQDSEWEKKPGHTQTTGGQAQSGKTPSAKGQEWSENNRDFENDETEDISYSD